MSTIKVKLGSEIRRIAVTDGTNFDQLVASLQQLFQHEDLKNYNLMYVDEEDDLIVIRSSDELEEALRVGKNLKPPILRINLVPIVHGVGIPLSDSLSLSPSISNVDSVPVSDEFSNWGKKLREEEDAKRPVHHVVKVCGVPFSAQSQSTLPPSVLNPALTTQKSDIKKSISTTVQEKSEVIANRTLQFSDEAAQKVVNYSNSTLQSTGPYSQSISAMTINTANMSERLTDSPSIEYSITNNDDVVRNVSSKQEQYSRETISKLHQLALGVNQNNESLYSRVSSDLNDYAEKSIRMVDQYTQQVMDLAEDARSRVNTDVYFNFQTLDNNNYSIDIENKVNAYSSNTSNTINSVADNIASNIMDI